MSREGAYIVFCMERYRHAKHLTGAAVANLFSRYGVFAHLRKYFGALHTMAEEFVFADIDAHIARCRYAIQ